MAQMLIDGSIGTVVIRVEVEGRHVAVGDGAILAILLVARPVGSVVATVLRLDLGRGLLTKNGRAAQLLGGGLWHVSLEDVLILVKAAVTKSSSGVDHGRLVEVVLLQASHDLLLHF